MKRIADTIFDITILAVIIASMITAFINIISTAYNIIFNIPVHLEAIAITAAYIAIALVLSVFFIYMKQISKEK